MGIIVDHNGKKIVFQAAHSGAHSHISRRRFCATYFCARQFCQLWERVWQLCAVDSHRTRGASPRPRGTSPRPTRVRLAPQIQQSDRIYASDVSPIVDEPVTCWQLVRPHSATAYYQPDGSSRSVAHTLHRTSFTNQRSTVLRWTPLTFHRSHKSHGKSHYYESGGSDGQTYSQSPMYAK